MAVHIRLARGGAKKSPFYRIVVTDQRSARDGRFLENIGTFDPRRDEGIFQIKAERFAYWQGTGAIASPTVTRLVKRHMKALAAVAPAAEVPAKAAKSEKAEKAAKPKAAAKKAK